MPFSNRDVILFDDVASFLKHLDALESEPDPARRTQVAQDTLLKALLSAQDEFLGILGGIESGIVILDKAMQLCYANQVAVTMAGYTSLEHALEVSSEELLARFEIWDEAGQRLHISYPRLQDLDMETSFSEMVVHLHREASDLDCWVSVKPALVLDSVGQLRFLVVVIHDITATKKDQLHMVELARVVEQIADHVIITDDQGTIEYVNPAFSQVTGYSADEAIGQNPRILKSGEQPLSFYEKLWQTILSGEVFRATFINRRKNGEFYYDEKTITPIVNVHGQTIHFVSAGRDVTVRVEYEAQQKENNRELKRLNEELAARNEELDAYAHTVAHDLKNPLAIVTGYAELLREDYNDLETREIIDYLDIIVRRAAKIDQIIESLLLLASVRLDNVVFAPLNMAEIVEEALSSVSSMIIAAKADISQPQDWPVAFGYAPWIEEVWANYVSNALKYGGDPPCIELGGAAQADGSLLFWVKDEGPGLDLDAQKKLFQPFESLGKHTRGHGLGLSIVKRIVEKQGGKVGSECLVGEGCRFFFSLPSFDESQLS